jgi:hypothetical protein
MRNLQWLIPAALLTFGFSARADTIPPGAQIPVRIDNTIAVHEWDKGRIYPGRVARDVFARDGDVAIPEGSYAELIVRRNGPDQMMIDIESVTVNGRRYVLDTSGPQFNTRAYENGGGLVGSIVGAIAGVETGGGEIRVPGGSVLNFQLQAPLHVVDWQDPGYDQRGYHYHRDNDWYR